MGFPSYLGKYFLVFKTWFKKTNTLFRIFHLFLKSNFVRRTNLSKIYANKNQTVQTSYNTSYNKRMYFTFILEKLFTFTFKFNYVSYSRNVKNIKTMP